MNNQSNIDQKTKSDVNSEELSDRKRSDIYPENLEANTSTSTTEDECFEKSRGVILIESVKDLMKEEGKGSKAMWVVIISILILAWSLGLNSSTTRNYEVYATSSYGHHTLISTLSIASDIINAVSKLFFAKFSVVTSRPTTLLLPSILCYWIHYCPLWFSPLFVYCG